MTYVYHVVVKFNALHKCTMVGPKGSYKHPDLGSRKPQPQNSHPPKTNTHIHIIPYYILSFTSSKIQPLLRRYGQIYFNGKSLK